MFNGAFALFCKTLDDTITQTHTSPNAETHDDGRWCVRKAGVVFAVAAAAGDVAKSCCESLVARRREGGLLLRNSCSSSCAEKTAAKEHLLLSHSPLGCQMLPLVRCHGIHCTIPSWYNRWTSWPRMSLMEACIPSYFLSKMPSVLRFNLSSKLLKLRFLSNCETLRQGGVRL